MTSETSLNRRLSASTIDAAIIAAVFILSRLLSHAAGVGFDSSTLGFFSQFIDPPLLRNHLLESVWYLHSQPPLFNLAVGAVLKIEGATGLDIFPLLWQICGLAIALMIYRLTFFLTGSRRWSLVAAIFLVASPASIVYENWLFYTYPVAALVLLWILLFAKVVRRPSWLAIVALGATVLALGWTRSVFHIGIVALLLALSIVLSSRESRHRLKIMSVAVLALIGGLYLKNYIMFDRLASSSWFGMSLARISVMKVDSTVRVELVDNGVLSPVSLLRPFSPAGSYRCDGTTPVRSQSPVLTAPLKQNGETNYNHFCYLKIEEAYRLDAYHVIGQMPGAYAKGMAAAWLDYFIPSSDFWFRNRNREAIAGYERIFNIVFFGQIQTRDQIAIDAGMLRMAIDKLLACSLWLIVLMPLTIVRVIQRAREVRHDDDPIERARVAVLILATALIVVFSVVTNLVEVGENNRIRFEIEPLLIAVVVSVLVGRKNI